MRFMSMYTPSKDRAGLPPTKEHMAEMAKLIDEATKTGELIAGFAILQLKSKEAAIESAKRFLNVAGEGECEIRQIMDAPPDVAA